jgi:hypothetical protein
MGMDGMLALAQVKKVAWKKLVIEDIVRDHLEDIEHAQMVAEVHHLVHAHTKPFDPERYAVLDLMRGDVIPLALTYTED